MGTQEEDDDDVEGEPLKSRTGPFFVPHRDGARVEVSEPIPIGPNEWLCAVKLVGKKILDVEGEPTQTLLVRTGRGSTPAEAQRHAMAQLTLMYGTPVGPPPIALITQKPSDPPPPPADAPAPEAKKQGLFARLFRKSR
jgi:hypothetical protein